MPIHMPFDASGSMEPEPLTEKQKEALRNMLQEFGDRNKARAGMTLPIIHSANGIEASVSEDGRSFTIPEEVMVRFRHVAVKLDLPEGSSIRELLQKGDPEA